MYSALTDDGQIVAVKQIELDTKNWSQAETDYKIIQREVDIQKTLKHPNIVKYVAYDEISRMWCVKSSTISTNNILILKSHWST